MLNDAPGLRPLFVAAEYLTSGTFRRFVDAYGFAPIITVITLTVVSFLALTVAVAFRFATGRVQGRGMLRLLRGLANLCTSVLFIPFSGVMMQSFHCNGGDGPETGMWMGTDLECGSPGHYLLGALMGLILLLFTVLSLFITATFVDTSPISNSWSARIHSRIDVAVLGMKLLFTLVWSLSLGLEATASTVHAIPACSLLLVLGSGWCVLIWWYAPFIRMRMNAIVLAEASIFTWACLAALLHTTLRSRGLDPSLMVLMGAPVVALSSYHSFMRRAAAASNSPRRAAERSVAALELWARLKLRSFVQTPSFAAFLQAQRSSNSSGESHSLSLYECVEAWKRSLQLPATPGPQKATSQRASVTFSANAGHPSTGTAVLSRTAGAGAELELELSDDLHLLRALGDLNEAVQAYRRLADSHAGSELALTMAAAFLQAYSPFQYSEMLALYWANRLHSSIDTQYRVFRRLRQLQLHGKRQGHSGGGNRTSPSGGGTAPKGSAGGSAHAATTIVDRVLVEQSIREIRRLERESLSTSSKLWTTLGASTVDLANVVQHSLRLQSTLQELGRLYKSVLRSDPNSTAMLRGYAIFLREKLLADDAAQEYDNRADRLEEAHSRRLGRTVRHVVYCSRHDGRLDETDESMAAVVISGEPSNLGEIVEASVGTCKLLQYRSAQQLIGANVKELIPEPIRTQHDSYLQAFAQKQSSVLLDKPLCVFAATADRYILPVWLEVTEAPPDSTTVTPRFTGLLEPILTSEQHLMCGPPDQGFRIQAATASTFQLLGLTPDNLRGSDDETVFASTYFPTLPEGSEEFVLVVKPTSMRLCRRSEWDDARSAAQQLPPLRPAPLVAVGETSDRSSAVGHSGGRQSAGSRASASASPALAAEARREEGDAHPSLHPLHEHIIVAAQLAVQVAQRSGSVPRIVGTGTEVLHASDDEVALHINSLLRTPAGTDVMVPVLLQNVDGLPAESSNLSVVIGGLQRARHVGCSFFVLHWRPTSEVLRHASHRLRSLLTRDPVRAASHSSASMQQLIKHSGPSSKPGGGGGGGGGSRGTQVRDDDEHSLLGSLAGGHVVEEHGDSDNSEEGNQKPPLVQALSPVVATPHEDSPVPLLPNFPPRHLPGPAAPHGEQRSLGPKRGSAVSFSAATKHAPHAHSMPTSARRGLHKAASSASLLAPSQRVRLQGASPKISRRNMLAQPEPRTDSHSGRMSPWEGHHHNHHQQQQYFRLKQPDQQSHASSEASSSSQQRANLSRMLARQRGVKDHDVVRIQYVLLCVALIVLFIGGANLFWVSQTQSLLGSLVRGLHQSGQRVVVAQQAMNAAVAAMARSAGVDAEILPPLDTGKQQLWESAQELRGLHETISVAGDAFGTQSSYVEREVPRMVVLLSQPVVHQALLSHSQATASPSSTNDDDRTAEPCASLAACDQTQLSLIGEAGRPFWISQDQIRAFNAFNPTVASDSFGDNFTELTLQPSEDQAVLELQAAWLEEEVASVAHTATMPLAQLGEFFAAMLQRIADGNGTFDSSNAELLNALCNDDAFLYSANATFQARALELVTVLPRLRNQLQVTGMLCFVGIAVLQTWFVGTLVVRVNHHIRGVARLLLLVPRRSCQLAARMADARMHRLTDQGIDSDGSREDPVDHLHEGVDGPAGGMAASSIRSVTLLAGTSDRHFSNRHLSNSRRNNRNRDNDSVDSDQLDERLIEAGVGAGLLAPAQADGARRSTRRTIANSRRSLHARRAAWNPEKKVPLRPHSDTSKAILKHNLRLAMSALPILLWLAFVFVSQLKQQSQLESLANQSVLTNLLTQTSMSLQNSAFGAIMSRGPSGRTVARLRLERTGAALEHLAEVGLFGGELLMDGQRVQLAGLQTGLSHFDLFLTDGCIGSADADACRTVDNGILAEGTYSGVMQLVALGWGLASELPHPTDDPQTPLVYGKFPKAWERLVRTWKLADPHLVASLQRMSGLLADELVATLQQRWIQSLWATVIFVAVYAVVLISTLHWVANLAQPLLAARGVLARLPNGVRRRVGALQQALRDMAFEPNMEVVNVQFDPKTLHLDRTTSRRRCFRCFYKRARGRISPEQLPGTDQRA